MRDFPSPLKPNFLCECRNQNRAMETKPSEISSGKMFGGYNKRFKHFSPTLGCSMNFHIYFPPSPSPSHKFPVSSSQFFPFSFQFTPIQPLTLSSFPPVVMLSIKRFCIFCLASHAPMKTSYSSLVLNAQLLLRALPWLLPTLPQVNQFFSFFF